MTFPLGSLHSDAAGSGKAADRRAEPASHPRTIGRLHRVPKTPVVAPVEPLEQTMRFQAALLLGGVLWILMVLAMASHDRLDPAFTTSGQHAVPHNWVGQLGAYVSDILQMLLGHSAWWLPLVGLRVWLGALALWMRRDTARSVARVPVPVETVSPMSGIWRVWLGLALVLSASCALEWSRLYRFEGLLPGHAGGMLGYVMGPLAMKWLVGYARAMELVREGRARQLAARGLVIKSPVGDAALKVRTLTAADPGEPTDLGRLLGPQPAVPELGPAESQNRFNLVFQRFLGALARPVLGRLPPAPNAPRAGRAPAAGPDRPCTVLRSGRGSCRRRSLTAR